MEAQKKNLLGLTQSDLEELFVNLGYKRFHAKQFLRWTHQKHVTDINLMSDFSKDLRKELSTHSGIYLPEIVSENTSKDGTVKWLFDSGVGQAIEAVFIPEIDRGTLCISSQVGCALDCSFCATGHQGFNRNLTAAEIVGQLYYANDVLSKRKNGLPAITNVVFMGMGEPLANFKNVIKSIEIMLSDNAYGLSRRRVTLSTAGVVPNIELLGDMCNVSMAVSLHAPNDKLRDELVPINKIHPIAELLNACWRYTEKRSNRYITFEYVMLKNINDSMEHARELTKLILNKPAKINLIPFNSFNGSKYESSSMNQIRKFQTKLREQGIIVTTRKTRGDDINAACGQLAGKVNNKVISRLSEKRRRPVNIH